MKIEIDIGKTHFFIILGAFLVLGVLGLAIAQIPPAINPGHSFDQVSGAARNCVGVNSQGCNNLPTGETREATAYASAVSFSSVYSQDSNNLDGIDSAGFCQSNGNGCPVTLATPVSGSVIGGGYCFGNNIWGAGVNCNGGTVNCPLDSTRRYMGVGFVSGNNVDIYICVKN